MNSNIIFRIYSPENEELKKCYNPIDTEPREPMQIINDIITESKENSIDKEGVKIQLVPPKQDADLKRIMKPMVDDLIGETKSILVEMRKKK